MDLLSGLNEPQRAAVMHESGPLLIFAGAGSGKTRTLTHRIAHLIQNGVPASRILAVTFTNKAAREMRERLERLVGAEANRLWMGTFHAMCAQMLRIHGHLIGVETRFVIFDTDDSTRLMKEILREADVDSERYPPTRVLARISDAKNNLQLPADLERVAGSPYQRVIARLFTMYQARLRQSSALDFDDLLGEAVRLLRESEKSREYWSERFLHVLIDEFQDVNQAQFEWAKTIAAKHRNICVVGDDDQSIYAWRGADVGIILDFEQQYGDAQIIRLEQNYRSTQNILDAAHGVISHNFSRKAKKLWTEVSGGETITLHGAANAQEEALWVARQIEITRRERDLKLSDFAILCRVNAQSRAFEEGFMRLRMPLKLVGTQRFYDRKEIRDVVSYLKVLYNPHDSLALQRLINVPPRGIGAATIEKLQMIGRESGLSLFEVILNCPAEVLGRAVHLKISSLRRLLVELQFDLEQSKTIVELMDRVLDRTNFYEFLRGDKAGNGNDRIANVEEFLAAASNFDQRMSGENFDLSDPEMPVEGAPYLGLFLQSAALESGTETGETAKDAVSLMTLHSAKGLEFPIVFLVGMEQGLLPHSRAIDMKADSKEIEEERRLCYVGLTRAEEQIFLTYAAQRTMHGRTETTQPSQFLDELPPALLQRSGFAKSGAAAIARYATTWDSARPTSANPFQSTLTSAKTPASSRPTEPARYAVGDRLKHPTFGEGVVVDASPHGGANEWVQIAFLSAEVGKKTLIVAFAPLEKL